jgi:mRNA interferase HigB
MRVLSHRTLREFWQQPGCGDAEQPLLAWYHEAIHASWRTPAEIKAHFRSASILKNNRVVFNVAGNKYRLVVRIRYDLGKIYVRFIGTHKEYDTIDAETV